MNSFNSFHIRTIINISALGRHNWRRRQGTAATSGWFPVPFACSNFNSSLWIMYKWESLHFTRLNSPFWGNGTAPEGPQKNKWGDVVGNVLQQKQNNHMLHATYTILAFRRHKCIFYVVFFCFAWFFATYESQKGHEVSAIFPLLYDLLFGPLMMLMCSLAAILLLLTFWTNQFMFRAVKRPRSCWNLSLSLGHEKALTTHQGGHMSKP